MFPAASYFTYEGAGTITSGWQNSEILTTDDLRVQQTPSIPRLAGYVTQINCADSFDPDTLTFTYVQEVGSITLPT